MRNWRISEPVIGISGHGCERHSPAWRFRNVHKLGCGWGVSYRFTVNNTGSTGGSLFDLFLALPIDIVGIDTNTIGTPVGWGDTNGGLLFFGPNVSPSTSFIEWAADASGTFDIGIGNQLSAFGFTSTSRVRGPIEYGLNGSTTLGIAQQVNIPEPGTLSLLLLAAAAFRTCTCKKAKAIRGVIRIRKGLCAARARDRDGLELRVATRRGCDSRTAIGECSVSGTRRVNCCVTRLGVRNDGGDCPLREDAKKVARLRRLYLPGSLVRLCRAPGECARYGNKTHTR